MVFYTGNLIREFNNPTIVVLTDRNDLDEQLFNTFAKSSDLLGEEPKRADKRKLSEEDKLANVGCKDNSKVKVYRIPTDEEFIIARDTEMLVK